MRRGARAGAAAAQRCSAESPSSRARAVSLLKLSAACARRDLLCPSRDNLQVHEGPRGTFVGDATEARGALALPARARALAHLALPTKTPMLPGFPASVRER